MTYEKQHGVLRIACRPGDIIAWGQKNLRRPGDSEHYLLLMKADGRMKLINKTEAWRHWQNEAKSVALPDGATAA